MTAVVALAPLGCSDGSGDGPGATTTTAAGAMGGTGGAGGAGASGGGGQKPAGSCQGKQDCEAGEICVVDTPNDPTWRCVKPACQDYGPDNPALVSPSLGWLRKVLDDAVDETLVCNDGCPYAYYVRDGVGAKRDNWLIFFKGGGMCTSDEECAPRWLEKNTYMTQQSPSFTPTNGDNQSAKKHGILSRHPDNGFNEWTHVYLHYCSSDFFAGDTKADDDKLGLAFRGATITNAVVAELMAGIDESLPKLADANNVLIAGGSAGAAGVRAQMDRIATTIWAGQSGDKATIKGFPDAAFGPPIKPAHFLPLETHWTAVHDEDCKSVHSTNGTEHLCLDAIHMVNGKGIAEGSDIHADGGHLKTVDSVFVFMDQYDGTSLGVAGVVGECLAVECSDLDACPEPQECVGGICYTKQSCTPELCKEEPCYGKGKTPACLQEQAVHQASCSVDADCDKPDDICTAGICRRPLQEDCNVDPETLCDTEDGFDCGFDGVCYKVVESKNDCPKPRYEYVGDLKQCRQVAGCNEFRPCPGGYACTSRMLTPFGQTFAWGVRQAFADPLVSGAYLPTVSTHTAAGSDKYFKTHFPNTPDNDSLASTLDRWFHQTGEPYKWIAPPKTLHFPLRAADLAASPSNMDFSAFPGGQNIQNCAANDKPGAKIFVLCGVNQTCDASLSDVLGSRKTGSANPEAFVDGVALKSTQRVVLKMLAGQGPCSDKPIEIGAGEKMSVVLDGKPLAIALPKGKFSLLTLYVSEHGATFDNDNTVIAGLTE